MEFVNGLSTLKANLKKTRDVWFVDKKCVLVIRRQWQFWSIEVKEGWEPDEFLLIFMGQDASFIEGIDVLMPIKIVWSHLTVFTCELCSP